LSIRLIATRERAPVRTATSAAQRGQLRPAGDARVGQAAGGIRLTLAQRVPRLHPRHRTPTLTSHHARDLLGRPFCAEGANCFRIGADTGGNAYIAVAGQEDRYLTDSSEALRTPILDIKAGKADHLLQS
jgi:hypothetical protein